MSSGSKEQARCNEHKLVSRLINFLGVWSYYFWYAAVLQDVVRGPLSVGYVYRNEI
jgi:hypothetical protein